MRRNSTSLICGTHICSCHPQFFAQDPRFILSWTSYRAYFAAVANSVKIFAYIECNLFCYRRAHVERVLWRSGTFLPEDCMSNAKHAYYHSPKLSFGASHQDFDLA
ncbi:hypothetical protein BDR04DRAFT_478059 [Suillus decipiens]|nr:hypothetical protein BDR04DRAFT_478059 [Suillus decipiens]